MIQSSIAEANVNKAKDFSKYVSAKIFPIVFKPNSIIKIHKMMLTTFCDINAFTYAPLINRIENSKRFISIDIVSKTYISVSFFNLPPQVISYGINFTIMLK